MPLDLSMAQILGGVATIALTSTIGPALIDYMRNRQALKVKEQDAKAAEEARQQEWDRQDIVADRVVRAAEIAAARADEVAVKAAEVAVRTNEVAVALKNANAMVSETAKETGAQLRQIHTLVNSERTAGYERELLSSKLITVLLSQILELRAEQGNKPTKETLALLESNATKTKELENTLADRLKQTQAAEHTFAADMAKG
jgi:hypothetical protein